MVVAGTDSAVLMVESEAKELSEDQMLGGVLYGHMEMQTAIAAIKELAAEAGKPRWEFEAEQADPALAQQIEASLGGGAGRRLSRYRQATASERRARPA